MRSKRTYRCQIALFPDDPVDPARMINIRASSPREAALEAADGRWPEGATSLLVYVEMPGAPAWPNGMPMTLLAIRLEVVDDTGLFCEGCECPLNPATARKITANEYLCPACHRRIYGRD